MVEVIIRTQFPDAVICFEKITHKNNSTYPKLNIEFEFESSNYILHQHIYAKESCHMIICWNNNIDRNNRKKFSKYQSSKIPLIFSISEFLETGKIIFH